MRVGARGNCCVCKRSKRSKSSYTPRGRRYSTPHDINMKTQNKDGDVTGSLERKVTHKGVTETCQLMKLVRIIPNRENEVGQEIRGIVSRKISVSVHETSA